ncbi:CobB/CobQ-like glutamine amidotransferase domain-containing protein [Suillus bovinus]|uniref:CobB/CobQ-like glutamine amidotransferase domain-containing protein n=1 Tax=Suillus bovinus TaxID=48563 RepID=UPI001B878420|nr:CobB/CobQ-like glutamine amidotransferase domain-containing protein [Suillus bovinus]KAG2127462.1 CobB/CobQ-like glutamine amidotransferase domain-containing protein [Suillus bovinus]
MLMDGNHVIILRGKEKLLPSRTASFTWSTNPGVDVPVADVAVTRSSYGFDVLTGEAMAMGERTPIALLNPSAQLTNLAAASVSSLSRVKLSANWMCAASKEGEGAGLYAAVAAVGMELCPALGWKQGEKQREVSAPLSLIVTAFAPVDNIERTWTPQLRTDLNETTVLVFFDLAHGKTRMGGSALAQVFKEIGSEAPDVQNPLTVQTFFNGCQKIKESQPDLILAYHDRSDGGLFTTLVEICFAGRVGAVVSLDTLHSASDPVATFFNEEFGAVVQLMSEFVDVGFPSTSIHVIGRVNIEPSDQLFAVNHESKVLFSSTPHTIPLTKPLNVAILREQGVNGHVEMAWAFTAAGFNAMDVHMSDILSGALSLSRFCGLAACGGFSYGDVLGAGKGWAHSVLLNDIARKEFTHFFADKILFKRSH